MKRTIMAICDLEVSYASHFMEHMNQKKNIPFEVQAFTNLDQLERFAAENRVEILLISERALENRVKDWDIGQVIVLAEGFGKKENSEYPTVSKYQSSDSVIREVMAVYAAESKQPAAVAAVKNDAKVIGIYSPVGRCLKTTFALTLAQILSREKAVLYLNLESYSGFEQLFGVNYDRTLSDLIYYMRKDTGNLLHRLNGTVQTIYNLDYIPPVPFPQDIANVELGEWLQLLNLIRHESAYEVVVMDMGDGVEEICPLLERCDHIFMPMKSDFVSLAKIEQFEKLMEVWNGQKVLDRIQKIKLPYYSITAGKDQFLQQLMWSEFGDFVRGLIRNEKL